MEMLDLFNITITGARPGEILRGVASTAKKSTLVLVSGIVPPLKSAVLEMLASEYREKYLKKLGNIPYFNSLTERERESWVIENSVDKELDFADAGITVEMLELGNVDLPEEDINWIMSTGPKSAKSILDRFPRKAGSKAKRTSLIFLIKFWAIDLGQNIVKDYVGKYVDLEEGIIKTGISPEVYKYGDLSIFSSGSKRLPPIENLIRVFLIEGETVNYVSEILKLLTPAAYKSILQKIIRYRPLTVSIHDKIFKAEDVLLIVAYTLLTSPGSFVPDLQKFVSGLESFCKRLVIISLEDAYVENPKILLQLATSSIFSQKSKFWKPSWGIIKSWLEYTLILLNTPYYFAFDNREFAGFSIRDAKTPEEMMSAILDSIGSFEGDLQMARAYASKAYTVVVSKNYSRPEVMPIYHFIDQHVYPDFAYLLNGSLYITNSTKPFSGLFRNVFDQITGVNTRKSPLLVPTEEFIKEVRRAQRLAFDIKVLSGSNSDFLEKNYRVKYPLDQSWIAGMVGSLEIGKILVTVDPFDIHRFVAIRKPSRDLKNPFISEEEEKEVIAKAKTLLLKGVKPKVFPLEFWSGKKIYYRDGEWYLDDGIWDVERKINTVVKNTLDSNENFAFLLDNVSTPALATLIGYLTGYKSSLEFNKISRDGGGIYHSVTINDIYAYRFLRCIILLYPNAIRREQHSITKFLILDGPVMWILRNRMIKHLGCRGNAVISDEKWHISSDIKKRKMWEHQRECLETMKKRELSRHRGNFLWVPVGMGKTLIVLEFMRYLNQIKKLSNYVVYTLPSSAMASIISEIKNFEIPYNVVTKKSKLVPYQINLVEHDFLRRIENELMKIMSDALFIVDEVHKTLNDTKRTSVALECARISKDFIAMTGTPIIDSHIYKLIWWLSQIMKFEVIESNFFVAVNGMIAKKVSTGVRVNKIEVEATFTKKEEKLYESLVPIKLGGRNVMANHSDIRDAIELCYDAVTRTMIDEIMGSLDGVFVVAKNNAHQLEIKERLVAKGIPREEIFILTKDQSIILTEENPKYKIVITTPRKSEGYTLTSFNKMVTSVYFTNNATREQLEGRINRIGQTRSEVTIKVVHIGILTFIMNKHREAASLSAVLSTLADEI